MDTVHANGSAKPALHMNPHPHQRSADLWDDSPPEALFHADATQQPQAPKLSHAGEKWFAAPLPPLQGDIQVIWAARRSEKGEEAVREYAAACFESEPQRSQRRSVALGIVAGVDRRLQQFQDERATEVEHCQTTKRIDLVLTLRQADLWNLTTIPKAVLLVSSLILFIVGFLAELKNSVYLVVSAGLGFEGDYLGALAFVLPVIMGPFVTLKYLEKTLDPQQRKQFARVMSWISGPVCLLTVGLFSWTIGEMHSDMDLLGGGGESWTSPLWALLGCEMAVLALMVTMLTSFLSSALMMFFEHLPHENAEHAEAARRVARLDAAIDETHNLRARMAAVIRRLNAERQAFIAKCLADLHRQKAALAARNAQLDSDPLID